VGFPPAALFNKFHFDGYSANGTCGVLAQYLSGNGGAFNRSVQHHLRDFCLRMLFMSRRKRSKLTAAQKTEIWKRWKVGQSSHEIGRAFDKPHTTVHQFLLLSGGIRPAARCRSRLALTLAEREDISRGIPSGSSTREIARRMNRAASTVSREVIRHDYVNTTVVVCGSALAESELLKDRLLSQAFGTRRKLRARARSTTPLRLTLPPSA